MKSTSTVFGRSFSGLATALLITGFLAPSALAEGPAAEGKIYVKDIQKKDVPSRCLSWSDGCNTCQLQPGDPNGVARCTQRACIAVARETRCFEWEKPKDRRQCGSLKKKLRSATKARDLASKDYNHAAGRYLGCLNNMRDDVPEIMAREESGNSAKRPDDSGSFQMAPGGSSCVVSDADGNRCGQGKKQRPRKKGGHAQSALITTPKEMHYQMEMAADKLADAESALESANWDYRNTCLRHRVQDAVPREEGLASPEAGSSSAR